MPKPVPNLCTACVQAWAQLVHWSYCLATFCTLELLLGHSLYTTLVLLGHSSCISCVTSLDTACTPEGYCLGTFGTLYRATPCAQLAHYYATGLSITCSCALLYNRIQSVTVNGQQQNNYHKNKVGQAAFLVKEPVTVQSLWIHGLDLVSRSIWKTKFEQNMNVT